MKIDTVLARINDFHSVTDPFGASVIPIYQTATFDLKKQTGSTTYDYSRSGNPTRQALEDIFCHAEGGKACICTNTGLSAIALLFEMVLENGDCILTDFDIYGGSNRLLTVYQKRNNLKWIRADLTDISDVSEKLAINKVKLVLCESPTNPGLKIIDIRVLSEICKKNNALLAVDNSLATFASQQPLLLGADFSLFSSTKFISGHGAVISGALVVKDEVWKDKLNFMANAEGRAAAPFDTFLVSLGLPTLLIRMQQQERSALKIAEFLHNCSQVKSVSFPFLPGHPQQRLARIQMKICPSVLTFEMHNPEAAVKLISFLQLFGEKVSFGNSDSRIEQPSRMSHASLTDFEKQRCGISDATLRISVGLESIDDLLTDLEQAFEKISNE